METKYPLEVGSVIRKNKAFSIMSYLKKAEGSEGEPPLEVYSKMSRYTFSILEKNDGRAQSVTVNIRTSEIEDIVKRSEFALQKHLGNECSGANVSDEANSIAYTVKFAMGSYKGKSPASMIAEGKLDELKSQKAFLKANIGKYPKNQKLIDAIDEAMELNASGKLAQSSNMPVADKIILYQSGLKPQQRKQRDDGKSEVHEAEISWTVGSDYPVTVQITNYYADVTKQADGRLNVKNPDQSSRVTLRVTVSEAEWMDVLRKINTNMSLFEMLQARATFAEANKIFYKMLGESKKAW